MIKKLREMNRELASGRIRAIPYGLDRLHLPGIVPGLLSCITAATNVGKTPLAKFIWVIKPIEFAIKHNLNLKILYFALEESKEEFYWSLYSYLCHEKFGYRYNINDFEGLYNTPISEQFLRYAEEHKIDELVELYLSYIEVYDTTYTTQTIFSTILEKAYKDGSFYHKDGTKISFQQLLTGKLPDFYEYIPNFNDTFRIAVVDHISLLSPTKTEKDLRTAIDVFVNEQARKVLTKRLNYFVGVVHQQVSYGEDVTYKKGKALEPTKDKLADNKTVGRTYLELIGLFDPVVYASEDKKTYKNYVISDLKPFFRILSVLKARRNTKDKVLPLFFDGKVGYMEPLPSYKDVGNLQEILNYIRDYKND